MGRSTGESKSKVKENEVVKVVEEIKQAEIKMLRNKK